MDIFSKLVFFDAKWVPTGKEAIEMIAGTAIESQYGLSIKCTVEDGHECYIPLWSDLTVPVGTQFKGFKWIEVGMIGRRWDNKFHDEDVKDSTERVYRVSELIY